MGDGNQSKPYLHVTDCVAGILHVLDHGPERLNVYNLAPPDATSVRYIAQACVDAAPAASAEILFTGGTQGWPGDVPTSRLSPEKLALLGFQVSRKSDQAVYLAVADLASEVFGT